MSFGQLIRQVQEYSGMTYQDCKESLTLLVEAVAARLNDETRQEFASLLPEQLQNIALSVYPMNPNYDIVGHFMYYQNISKSRAIKEIIAAWQAIGREFDKAEANFIESELPDYVTLVHKSNDWLVP